MDSFTSIVLLLMYGVAGLGLIVTFFLPKLPAQHRQYSTDSMQEELDLQTYAYPSIRYEAEPTQEQLLGYIDAAMTFYEQVKGQGRMPTNKQIHALLATCGIHVGLVRIKTNREMNEIWSRWKSKRALASMEDDIKSSAYAALLKEFEKQEIDFELTKEKMEAIPALVKQVMKEE